MFIIFGFRWLVGLVYLTLWAGFFTRPVLADNLIQTLSGHDINQVDFMQSHNLSLSGWLTAGATYNTGNPENHNNSPVTFNDRSAEFQLNQFYVTVQKSLDMAAKHWNIGGKLDLMFGTDSRFTQASGFDGKLINPHSLGLYSIAIPQAYLEIFAPVGKGITAKIGHFYTLMGQEVVTAPNNFFYSHAYAMQYGEPFTHSGVMLSYAINENFTVNAGAVTGWDNVAKDPGNWNFLGGVSWANDDATSSIAWSVISGNINATSSNNRSLSSLVISHQFTDQFRYVFQQDFGYQEAATHPQTACWYGLNQYFFYDVSDSFSLGLRAEWFRDNAGTRLPIHLPGNYFEITAGANWQALPWLKLRPEIRFDTTDTSKASYLQNTQNQQLTIAMDVVLTF